jgi:gluconate 2-dehydrogenase alpha chain
MTYTEMDPYYTQWEKAWGVTGTNQGPFQPMSQNFPLPPHPYSNVSNVMLPALESLGYHPYPTPTALASLPYTNQYGVSSNACVYDGWCAEPCNFVCEVGAKSNTAFRTVPAAISSGNLTINLNSFVFRLDVDPSSGLVSGARYYDSQGNVHVQPAKVFYNGIWGYNIVRLMLLSGIGNPYDPSTVTGSLGRGTEYGVPPTNVASVTGKLGIGGNLYPAGNAEGGGIDILDLADDNFDHSGLNFIGGGMLRAGVYLGSGPANLTIASGVGPNTMGSSFKASIKNYYLLKKTPVALSMDGPELEDTRWNVDLDPHHTDMYGDPIARWTYDFGANAYNCATYLSGSLSGPAAKILQKMGCTDITVHPGVAPGQLSMEAWPAHVRGGCRMGKNSSTSVLNMYGQTWTCHNLFAGGEITDTTGDNTTIGGTHPMGASLYLHAEGIRKYLESPGPLVS